MPDPFFNGIGNKISKPFLIDADNEDGVQEFDLGELIVRNSHGQTEVKVETNDNTSFIQLIKVGNSYKLRVNTKLSKPGHY